MAGSDIEDAISFHCHLYLLEDGGHSIYLSCLLASRSDYLNVVLALSLFTAGINSPNEA